MSRAEPSRASKPSRQAEQSRANEPSHRATPTKKGKKVRENFLKTSPPYQKKSRFPFKPPFV